MSQNNELLASYKVFSLLEAASDNAESMLDNMPGVMVVLNQNLRVIRANQEFARLAGQNIETVLGFDFISLFSAENTGSLLRHISLLKSYGRPNKQIDFELEIFLPKDDRGARQYFWQASLVDVKRGPEGDLISIVGKDLSALYQSEMKLNNIFANLPLGMLMIDYLGNVKEVLSQFTEVLFDSSELVGKNFVSLFEDEHTCQDKSIAEGLTNLQGCLGKTKTYYSEIEKTLPRVVAVGDSHSVTTKWININYQPILKRNRVDGFILLIEDATEAIHSKKEMERVSELERQIQKVYEAAIRDPLTGLYTRLFMKDSVKSLVSNFQRGRIEELSILMMDIDHFKAINDTYGHKVGDAVITEVGKIILKQIRETDIAIRYGGEEFLIIVPSNLSDMTSAKVLAERIRVDVESLRYELETGQYVTVTISGGASWCAKNETVDVAIDRADSYLYQAKSRGRNLIVTEGDA